MGEKFIWEVKYHTEFSTGDRYGSRDFDMMKVRSEQVAFDKKFEIYDIDEFNLVLLSILQFKSNLEFNKLSLLIRGDVSLNLCVLR